MLFVALSCLQGRVMTSAFDELAALNVGIQLTPGNLPARGFREHVAASGVITRRHHGFTWRARKTETWVDAACAVESESVHPPLAGEHLAWREWFERADTRPILEVMYPGYALGTGDEVERAMDDGIVIAVDVSHVFLQITAGAMHDRTWRRLQDYQRIAEVHVSANGGQHDSHRPLVPTTFGLPWARERVADHPVILECYMHKLTTQQRFDQLGYLQETS
ncbi:MAG: hypothetical protein QM831_36460 [Kofleriaceae bacterium]